MMQRVKHETCEQYVARRLSEGWSIVYQKGYHLILSSPNGNILRPVDLRNDVETLRPDAAGDETNIEDCNTTFHWQAVDEVSPDGWGTVVSIDTQSVWQRDLYNLPDSGVGEGTINFIKIYFTVTNYYGQGYAKPALKSNGTITDGTQVTAANGGAWHTYSQQWNTNPADGNWEWSDIDALQIGVSIYTFSIGDTGCTQVYVEVDYTPIVLTEQAVGGGSIAPTGALGLLTKISPGAGSITPTGALTRLPKIQMGQGTITPAGTLGRSIKAFLVGQGSITPTGALAAIKKWWLSVGQGTITPTGGILSRAIKIAVGAGSITPTGALSTVKRFIQWVGQGSITPTGALSTVFRFAQSVGQGTITPVGTLGRNIFIAIGSGTITPIGTLGRKIALAVGAGTITPTGAMAWKALCSVGQGTVAIAGTLGRFIKVSVGGGTITPVGLLTSYFKRLIAIFLSHKAYRDVTLEARAYRNVGLDIRPYRDVELEMRGG